MPEIDPPKPGTGSLYELPNGGHNAADLPTGPDAWLTFAAQYRDAADALCDGVAADDSLRNFVPLPVLFLYRHSIELHLKSLLLDAGALLDDPQAVPPKHYLLSLWKRVRELLAKVDPRSDGDAYILRVEAIIQELDDLDPTSFAFRYPVDTAGAAALPPRLSVDLGSIRAIMDELFVLLDGASTQIDVYHDYKNEMRQDGY